VPASSATIRYEHTFDYCHVGAVTGGMRSRRDGLTLAQRSAVSGVGRERPVGARHCWVRGLPGSPGRWPGPAGRVGAAWRRLVRPGGVRRGRRRSGGAGLGGRRAPRAGPPV